jgi:CheY-like chemotaxis protein
MAARRIFRLASGKRGRLLGQRAGAGSAGRERDGTEGWNALERLGRAFAHDLNNVFAAIASEADAVAEAAADPALRGRMASIAAAVRRGMTLTRRMMTDRHAVPVAGTIGDVNDDLRTALPRLQEAAGGAERLTVRMAWRPLEVRLDHRGLVACVEELLTNARAACPRGEPITLRSRLFSFGAGQDGERIDAVIEVEDAGRGMAPDVLARARDAFFTTHEPATGLGLAMVDQFAREAGGGLEIRSLVGRGTRVALRFPAVLTEPDGPPTDRRPGPLVRRTVGDARVLVVDDSAPLRIGTARRLRDAGFAVAEAEDADSARPIIAEGIDALVTDVVLTGGTDGFGLAGHARSVNPSTALVFISGFISARQPALLANDDLASFMRKPVDFDNLIAVLSGLLAAREGVARAAAERRSRPR